ncbi:MAG: VWA domain-containing protein [Dehalococcoidia bacterium]|nr:MAG: VWA domain-containing protein [Dehalococcoidia bacterium]
MTTVQEEIAEYREEHGLTCLLDDMHIFSNMRKEDFPKFVSQTIKLLSRNSGLRLIFGQDVIQSCFNTDTNTVTIPAPPMFPNKENKKEIEKFVEKLCQWRGVLNHEVGHAQFTLWRAKHKAETNPKLMIYSAEYHKFVDLFENGRMERVACLNYIGMHKDLIKLEKVLGDVIKKTYKEQSAEGKWNDMMYLYYGIRMTINGYEPVIELPEHLKTDWETCMGFVREAWETNDEGENIEIAVKAHEFFKQKEKELGEKADNADKDAEKTKRKISMKREELEKMMEEQEKQDGDDADEDGEKQKVQINDPKAEKSDEEQKQDEKQDDGEEPDLEIDIIDDDEDDESDESESDEGEEESVDESKGNDGENDGDPLESESDSNGEEKEDSDGNESKGGDLKGSNEGNISNEETLKNELESLKKELEQKEAEKEKAELEAGTVEDLKEIDPTEELAKDKKKELKLGRNGPVIPLPLHDYVDIEEVMPVNKSGSTQTNDILNDCLNQLSAMAQTFINKVRSSKHVGTRTYQGRVSTRSLHKYKHSRNIFKTESKRKKKDATVSIVVDCSGSMDGHKMQAARKSALVIGEMMFRANVEFELVGFTIPFYSHYDFSPFTRHANLIHYRFGGSKDWNFRKHGVVEGDMNRGTEDNDDGESLRHFADNLAQSKKERKMMIVLSDGQPSSTAQEGDGITDLKETIEEIRNNNIEVYAIGINTDAEIFYGKENSVRLESDATNVEITQAISTFVGMIGAN